MIDALLDALLDSLKVFAFVFCIYFILSYLDKLIDKRVKNKKSSPIIGAVFGLIPQCGVTVTFSDLYLAKRITLGTLIAAFLACSDEAVFILIGSNKWIPLVVLLCTKLILGLLFGYLFDFIFTKKQNNVESLEQNNECNDSCCSHHHKEFKTKNVFLNKLIHSLIHSLEVFAYVLAINVIFSLMIYFIGEDNILNFLKNKEALSVLLCVLIGLIPNCASSVIISELYVLNGIPFAALLAGLLVNAGLGIVYLFKNKKDFKNNVLIVISLIVISLISGYTALLIETII